MKKFWVEIAAVMVTAALIGNAAFLWDVRDRLARVETKLEFLTVGKQIAQNP